jgi:hypothetical protein
MSVVQQWHAAEVDPSRSATWLMPADIRFFFT